MKKSLLSIILSFYVASIFASEPVSKSFWTDVAIGGRDVLAYPLIHQSEGNRDLSQPLSNKEGLKKFVVNWNDAEWRFSDAESMEKFKANPQKYVPEFNGFCANALSIGEGLVKTDGTHWEIFGDKLFLFYSENGRLKWTEGMWEKYYSLAKTAWEKELKK